MDIKDRSNCSYCNSNKLEYLSYESTLKTIPAGLTRSNTEIFKGLRCRSCYTFFKKNTQDLSYKEDYSKSETYNSDHVLKEKLDEYHTRYSAWRRVRHARTSRPMEQIYKEYTRKKLIRSVKKLSVAEYQNLLSCCVKIRK